MFDEDFLHLQDNPQLQQLLSHYAEQGKQDRKIWQDRLMTMDGVAPAQITKLHGELLAFEWIEQNTGAARASYRITPSGIRALKRAIQGADDDEETDLSAEEAAPKTTRKKRASRSAESVPAEVAESLPAA